MASNRFGILLASFKETELFVLRVKLLHFTIPTSEKHQTIQS